MLIIAVFLWVPLIAIPCAVFYRLFLVTGKAVRKGIRIWKEGDDG